MSRNKRLSGPFLPVPRWVIQYTANDHIANTVLIFFLQYLHPDTQELTTSYQHIADQMGCSRRTVMRAINRLTEIGLVVKEHRVQNNRSLTNKYYINFNNPQTMGVVSAESLVSAQTPLVVSPQTLGSVPTDTTSSVPTDTQSRVINKSKKNKKKDFEKDGVFVDSRLLDA